MRKKTPTLILLSLLFLLLLLARLLERPQTQSPVAGLPKPPKPAIHKVLSVHDGDTITVSIEGRTEKIRLIGIDAPELKQRPWGMQAKKHLEELMKAREVVLEFDIRQRDKYGRLLAYLKTGDGELINENMIRDGYAVLYTFPPNVKYVERLKAAQAGARASRSGIWDKDGLKEKPSDYRKRNRR